MKGLAASPDPRLLTDPEVSEDAAIVTFPPGMALVQTVDFFTPIVNDPYRFGQIAAANSLSDVYAMGGTPWAAMNIVCFPAKKQPLEILRAILQGGRDKVLEAGAVLAGGHSVEDDEIKYGLAVSGMVDPARTATNKGFRPGDQLLLTKPLGTGVLATGIKARLDGAAAWEDVVYRWSGRLNAAGGDVIRALGLTGATDVTGFGLGGHLLETMGASGTRAELWLADIPFIPEAVELAAMGMLPAGSHANKAYCASRVDVAPGLDPILVDLVFDAQTSGGMLLAVPLAHFAWARDMLLEAGDLAGHVGQVLPGAQGPRLLLR